MLSLVRANLLPLLLGTRLWTLSHAQQHVFQHDEPGLNQPLTQPVTQPRPGHHDIPPAVLAALEAHGDPVDAFVSLFPESDTLMAEPRLLHVAGEETPRWMTEGDKMRLRRRGLKFADITDHEEFYAQHAFEDLAGKASEFLPLPTSYPPSEARC